MTKLTFEQAKINIQEKFPNILKLLEFNGRNKEAKFLDLEFGEFWGNYRRVYEGSKKHCNRSAKNIAQSNTNRSKCRDFDTAAQVIKEKYPEELELLEFNGINKEAKFLDLKFGEFWYKFKTVRDGGKKHPERIRFNKENINYKIRQEKAIQTWMNTLGVKNPSLSKEVIEKRKRINLKNRGVTCPFQSEEVKQKSRQTNLNKRSVPYPMMNSEVRAKAKLTNIKNKNIKFIIDNQTLSEYIKFSNLKCTHTSLRVFIKTYGTKLIKSYKPTKQSKLDLPIIEFLKSKNVKYSLNQKSESTGSYRPDIFIKEASLAIECDGLYWHSDAPKNYKRYSSKYHMDKQKFYKDNNIKGLFFREDEILFKTDIVSSIISNKLNLSNKIFARKCEIKELASKEAHSFFQANHLMGSTKGKTYGLFFKQEAVAAIKVINKLEGLKIERFCNKKYFTVIGGFSKLLKYCINIYNPKKVISFVDLRYGDGSSLEKLGFQKNSVHLSFKWTNCKYTFPRMRYPGKSGYSNSLFKIYDCGQAKYSLDLD